MSGSDGRRGTRSKWPVKRHKVKAGQDSGFDVFGPGGEYPIAHFPTREAAQAAAAAADEKKGIKQRKCMCCRQDFLSSGHGNRLCVPCRRAGDTADENYRVSL